MTRHLARALGPAMGLLLFSVAAYGQSASGPVHAGSIVVGGATSINFNRMTVSNSASTTPVNGTASNPSINSIVVDAGLTYYKTPKFGFGAVLGLTHLSLPSSGSTTNSSVSIFSVGGVGKFRFPMGEKKDFYVEGAGGYGRLSGSNGYYFSGGAGADIWFRENVAINLGAVYQHTTMNSSGFSGLAVAMGFSFILK